MDKKLFVYLGEVGIGDNDEDAGIALQAAADVCGAVAKYLETEQPYATESIDALKHASDTLRSCATED